MVEREIKSQVSGERQPRALAVEIVLLALFPLDANTSRKGVTRIRKEVRKTRRTAQERACFAARAPNCGAVQ